MPRLCKNRDFIQQTSIWVAFKHPISAHHIHNVLMQIGGL
ncbi:hypothetical protein XBKQ1_1020001 [Xenorhabdus bovienii str. kraussei Quebec]|uniref:Uncharacterized protein n=1 Tax=Xenorhabdus bovienii str. kraussei Quebec TaxID=1398203 RepID=A0A077PB32_XENBV|nr:hypothetical protein XBKQ1_1020001 [Xenorhabdus bovienii str. kraussei Quebec]